jgi:hypothetical protein
LSHTAAAPEIKDEAEANNLFAAASATGGKTSGLEVKPGAAAPKPGASTEKKADESKPADKVEETDDDPVKAAEARAKEMEDEDLKAVQEAEAKRILAEQEAAEAERAKAKPAQIDMSAVEKVIRQDLKDFKIPMVIDGQVKEVSIEEFEKDDSGYGEIARGSTRVAIAAAVKIASRMVRPLQEKIAAMEQAEQAKAADGQREKFLNEIATTTPHTDVREIASSNEFWKWADTQSDGIKRLIHQGTAKDIDIVLRAYKNEKGISTKAGDQGRSRAEIIADKARRKQADVDIHGNTMRGRSSVAPEGDGDMLDEDEAQKLFKQASGGKG